MQTLPAVIGPTDQSHLELNAHMHSKDPATLVLMEPKPQQSLGHFDHRPQAFHFTPRFREHFEDYMYQVQTAPMEITDVKQKEIGRIAAQENVLNISNQIDTRIDLTSMDYNWRFLLILRDQRPKSGRGDVHSENIHYATSLVKYDVLIEGYCIGEPISPFGGSLNPQCQLVITNKRVVRKMHRIGPYGGMEEMSKSLNYQNYVLDPMQNPNGPTDPTYQVDFNSCSRDIQTSNGQVVAGKPIFSGTNTGARRRVIGFDPTIYNTAKVFRTYAEHVKSAQDQVNGSYGGNHSPYDYSSMAHFQEKEDFLSTLTSIRCSQQQYVNNVGPNEGDYLTMKHLVDEFYIQPKVIRHSKEGVDTLSNTGGTPRDIFNPLIAEALIGLMAQHNISYMSFSFVSNFRRDDDEGHQWNVSEFTSPTISDTREGMQRCMSILECLKMGLFKSIYSLYGEFDVAVSAHLQSMIYIMLNFADNLVRFNVPYQYPACYAGIVSSTVGNANACHVNRDAYLNFVNTGLNMYAERDEGWTQEEGDLMFGRPSPTDARIHAGNPVRGLF